MEHCRWIGLSGPPRSGVGIWYNHVKRLGDMASTCYAPLNDQFHVIWAGQKSVAFSPAVSSRAMAAMKPQPSQWVNVKSICEQWEEIDH